MDDLARWRDEFPDSRALVYMISNSLGAMPAGPRATVARVRRDVGHSGVRGWEDRWWEMPREVGDKVARIIGRAPGRLVSMHGERHDSACRCAVLSRPTGTRRRIVCAAIGIFRR
jgi:kynureninase